MGRFSGVLIASDYDNTLVDTGGAYARGEKQGYLTPASRRAIEEFMAQGGIFSIATGRSLPSFNTVRQSIPSNGPTIMFNGAAIYDCAEDKYLFQAFLRESAREHLMQVCRAFPQVACEIYHDDNAIHVFRPNGFSADHLRLTQSRAVEVADLAPSSVPAPMSKALFEAEEDTLQKVVVYIRSQPWGGEYETVFSTPFLLEITTQGATKGGMVERLRQMLHIERENLYCMGDQNNDMDMLALAAIPFAPANAIPEVKAMPGIHLLPPCWEGTMEAVVEELSRLYP